jgi:sugar/nucleoside kinase (ribokinase family)
MTSAALGSAPVSDSSADVATLDVAPLDVVGIGNALVDVLTHGDDEFLQRHQLVKGSMTLIDTARSNELYEAMGPGIEQSGGSAGNTIAGIASFGGSCGYIGKIADDQLGDVFAHDLQAAGVAFGCPKSNLGVPTGRCLIVVTADGQRTMSTYLGVSELLGPDDVDADLVANAQVIYLEGYLWDKPGAMAAYRKAAEVAHAAGRRVSLTLSDSFCVARHREEFLDLVETQVDVLFANEAEITQLYEVNSFDAALQKVRGHCEITALTRSAKGSVIVAGDEIHVIDAHPVERVVDTTGAGDLYAAGFLFGLTRDMPLARCGQLGSMAAAQVISQMGPRPAIALTTLLR